MKHSTLFWPVGGLPPLARFTVIALAFCLGAQMSFAQTLNLKLVNSSTYADSDVWFTFTAAGAGSGTSAPAAAINAMYAGGANIGQAVPMLWSNSYTYVSGGTTYNSVQNTWWSESINLATLTGSGFAGFQISQATSPRVYVSLGAPLTVVGTGTLQDRGVLTNGTPSLSGTADPNFNKRWDQFEITVTPAYGDQGDITAINAIAIPMKMQSFSGTVPVQSTQNTTNWNALAANLTTFVNSNSGNNTYTQAGNTPDPVIYNGSGTTADDILRIIGVNNGAHAGYTTATVGGGGTVFTPAGGAGDIASIGAQAGFQDYVNHVASGTFVTPVEDAHIAPYNGAAANAFFGFSGSTYAEAWTPGGVISASWLAPVASNSTIFNSGTLTSDVTSGTGKALVMEGYLITATVAPNGVFPATGTLGKYKMTIPPDGGVSGSSFLLSSFLYASDASANYGGIFEFTPMSAASGGTLMSTSTYLNYQDFTSAIQLASGSLVPEIATNTPTAGQQMISQVVHDVSAGYNLGMVSSTVIDPATGTSFNNEGSLIWTSIWEAIKLGGLSGSVNYNGTMYVSGTGASSGTVLYIGDMPLYDALQPGGAYYNQWAYQIYQSSTSGYGNPYSDYLQSVDVNLLSSPFTTPAYNISDVVVTILPFSVPEASTWMLLLAAGAVYVLMKFRKKQKTAK